MLKAALAAVLISACTPSAYPDTPQPTIAPDSTWFVGQPSTVTITWEGSVTCDDNGWNCDSPPDLVLRVDSVTCDGCTITDDPSGAGVSGGIQTVGGAAARDDHVSMTAQVTFVPTGEHATVSTPIRADHEVSLSGDCELIDSALLATYQNDQESIPDPAWLGDGFAPFRPCGMSRKSTETIVIFPEVHTYQGDMIFPFVPDGTIDSNPAPDMRPLSELHSSVTPSAWWYADGRAAGDFAEFPNLTGVDHVELSTRLSSGAPASVSVAVPTAVCDVDCLSWGTAPRVLR